MPTGDNPVSQLRRLRSELRKQREAVDLTQREVAEALDWSLSKLIRIERGPVGISVTDVRALLQHYGATDKQYVEDLVELARASKRPGWWDRYRDTYSAQFLTFLALESSSIRIRKFTGLIVPGLLQEPGYIKAIVAATSPGAAESDVELATEVRLARQQLLGKDGPELFFVLDESVLHRIVGSPEIMRGQLEHMVQASRETNVTIQVVPYSVGVHKGMQGSFTVYELSEEQDDYALQLEHAYGDRLIQDTTDETREYLNIFRELEKIALPPAESIALVEQLIAEGVES